MEQWKPIKGYEELYEVSNLGRVKSLPRNGTIKEEKILKQYVDRYGYLYVGLRNKKVKKCKVHRLVAEAFIFNPNNLPQVNHKDENKQNNCVNNLEFCTSKYNVNYGHRAEKVSKKVVCIKFNGEKQIFKSSTEAGKTLSIDSSSITKCCKGKRETAGGYVWRYADEQIS